MVQFLDPESTEILQFLDPEIVKLDKQFLDPETLEMVRFLHPEIIEKVDKSFMENRGRKNSIWEKIRKKENFEEIQNPRAGQKYENLQPR